MASAENTVESQTPAGVGTIGIPRNAVRAETQRRDRKRLSSAVVARDDTAVGETASAAETCIVLLGGFSVTVAGQPIADRWRLRKAKTLVKLLALAPGHRLHRDIVVDSLWPDTDPQATANNLHQLVHTIRHMMGAESITLADDVVRLCPAGGLIVDVDVFEQAAANARSTGDITELRAALDRWTGQLLPEDSYADWAEEHRARLTETHAAVATLLGSKLFELGERDAALALLEPLASSRPLDEQLHRVLIDVVAGLGRRWEAIEIYERLRDALDDAYAAEPEPQTKALYRRLLSSGKPILDSQSLDTQQHPRPRTLVGRQREWERLCSSWQRASAGESHLILISGEAGIGKSHLAEELLTWADRQGIATARTRTYGAEGRLALAPVSEWLRNEDIRQSLSRLADVWLSEITRLLPELLEERPNLPVPEPMTEFGQRQRFFEALARAVLSVPQPLLLLIDDVQWCDRDTLQWLHFLLRFDPKKRVLVIGTARMEEFVPSRPVAEWLVQLRTDGSVIELALDPLDAAQTAQLAVQVAKRELDDQSALRLYRETEGNPLFVVEMASAGLSTGPQEPGNGEGHVSLARLATADLPPRMHAVIASRLAQLSPDAHELVGLAASVGRDFTVEILREASRADDDNLTQSLDELWQRRIIRAVQQPASFDDKSTGELFRTGATSFDFSHDKIRDVAYTELSPMKQRYWHLRVARALEVLYATNLDPVSAQLAAQYDQAGDGVRAIPYYQRAADVAQGMYAHEEAIGLLTHGLALLHHVSDKARRDELQLDLLRSLSLALVATRGYGAHEVRDTLSQAQALNRQLGKPPDPLLLRAAAIAALNTRKLQQGLEFGDQLLQLADQQGDPILLVEGHYVLGVTLSWVGSLTRSRIHLEQSLAHYQPAHSATHIARYSQDPSVVCQCRLAFDLWCLGYPEQAKAAQRKGLARAQELAHPFSLAYALTWDAMLHGGMRNINLQRQSADAVIALSDEHHFGLWSSWATMLRGWALAESGEPVQGIAEIQRGAERMHATGAGFLQPFISSLVAEQLARIGQVKPALELLTEALASTQNDPYWSDAELHRLKGTLLSRSDDTDQAEAAYRRAIQIAQKQQAKVFELRATTCLAQLSLGHGRSAEAREALAGAYGWFTEGLDTRDLKDARAVLESSERNIMKSWSTDQIGQPPAIQMDVRQRS
jgi:DNA-binding SARP family transcriptional activator